MKKILLNVLFILFAVFMVNSGLNKFFQYMPMPENMPKETIEVMGAFMKIGWIFPLVAITEIIAPILMAIPRTRALGAIMILPVMVGIILQHAYHAPDSMILPLVFLVINLIAIVDSKDKYLPMIGK